MGREAEPRLHGATDGEADLLKGGEGRKAAGSPPRRQEEDARVSSSRSPSAVAGDSSFRSSGTRSSSSSSSLASDVESDDDDDGAYPRTQCEYEEIPSFRWIASPLRWWKPKKGSVLSRKNTDHARTPIRDKEPGAPGGSKASETDPRLVHFEGYRTFTFDELLRADAEVLGKNTYWTTYKATLGDGSQMAVRRRREIDASKDFVAEVNLLGKIRHPNLLAPRAYHYTPDGEKFLVFDYMPKGSLSSFLHARGNSNPIDWPTRMNIAVGVARGLHHLHTQGNMVHGSLSSANVLLDCDANANIGGYGLSNLLTPAAAIVNFLEVRWTSGYNAPELTHLNKANTKTDVYSFGVIMLSLLTGKSSTGFSDKTQWVASITKVETTAQPEFHDILELALKCVDASPDARPEMQKVLQQLEEIKTTEITTSPFEDRVIQMPWPFKSLFNDGNMPQARALENTISSPLASSASDAEAMPAPIDSCKLKVEDPATLTPEGDLKDSEIPNPTHGEEITQNPSAVEELDDLNPADHRTGVRTDTERCNTAAAAANNITTPSPATAEITSPFEDRVIQMPWPFKSLFNDGNMPQARASENSISSPLASSASDAEAMPAPIDSCMLNIEDLATMTPEGDLKDPGIPNPTHGEEITQNPYVDEELDDLNPAEHRTGVRTGTKRCNAMSQGTEASPLSSIDWANVDIQVHLHVPTSPPFVSSDPDSGYQRFFRTLYDLAHRSPPLPCNLLEVQLNNMIMGLHSLGYPLDTWVNSANILLVHAKKKEYIEQHVDDYRVHVEMQLKEFTSAITPAKEDITGTQSEITVLEQKQEKLDDTIVKLKDQLALLETQRQEVKDSLATARDVLAVAEGKMESIFVRMNCLNQQYSAIPNLRRAMLLELPSLDEIFDSTFQEIMTKKF